jgi:3-phenylpropionate/trans-cinnamate dioxygenase ferredoxin subunit
VSTLTRTDVGSVDDFPEDGVTALAVEGREIVLIRQGEEFFALPDRCTHARFPLSDGELLEGKIKCAHHGATFDLRTGAPTLPAVKKIRLYEVEVHDGRVLVCVQEA